MWPFSGGERDDSDFPDRYGMTDVNLGPDVRHVDVAILWGLGQKDRAHEVARELTGRNMIRVGLAEGADADDNLRRVRENFKQGNNE